MKAKIKNLLDQVVHFGFKYKCPICNYSSRDLYKVGVNAHALINNQVIGGGERYSGCYKCQSVDRVRLVYLYLMREYKLFEKPKNLSILHMAPEFQISNKIRNQNFANYICGDLFTDGYTYPEYVQNMDVLNLPFNDNSFDLIICNHVLEHIDDEKKALESLYRVLKKSGTAILQVPISKCNSSTLEFPNVKTNDERLEKYGQYDHVRLYGQDYPNRLENVGFKVQKINISSKYLKYGVNPDEDLFLASK